MDGISTKLELRKEEILKYSKIVGILKMKQTNILEIIQFVQLLCKYYIRDNV